MKTIWSNVSKFGPMNHGKREAIRKERDDAIRALMSDDQRKQQTTILAQYDTKYDDIGKRMRLEQDAARKSRDESLKAVFDAEQRQALRCRDEKRNETKSPKSSPRNGKNRSTTRWNKRAPLLTPEQRIKYDELRKKREEMPHKHTSDCRVERFTRRPAPPGLPAGSAPIAETAITIEGEIGRLGRWGDKANRLEFISRFSLSPPSPPLPALSS